MCIFIILLFTIVFGIAIVLMLIMREPLTPIGIAAIPIAVYKTTA